MLDFLLPIKIFSSNKNYPSFFVKEVIFYNSEYALVKIDLDEKDKEYTDEHGDVVTIALPKENYAGYSNTYKIISPFFDNYQATNALKDKYQLKEMFSKIIKNECMSASEKQKILKEVFDELGYPNVRVVTKKVIEEDGEKTIVNFIRDFEDIGYVYVNEDFDTYIKITDEVISNNHNQLFPICELFKESSIHRRSHNQISSSNVYIEKDNDKLELRITDSYGYSPLIIKEGMSLNKKDLQLESRAINNIDNYVEFKKMLSALNDSLYIKNRDY